MSCLVPNVLAWNIKQIDKAENVSFLPLSLIQLFLSKFSGMVPATGSLVAIKAEDILLFHRDAYNAKAEQSLLKVSRRHLKVVEN